MIRTTTISLRSLSSHATSTLKLHHFQVGENASDSSSPPLFLLHGLLGSGNNFRSLCNTLHRETGRKMFALDLRNHGKSPHSSVMTYESMAADLEAFVSSHNIPKFGLLGHSLGGKVHSLLIDYLKLNFFGVFTVKELVLRFQVAMAFATLFPQRLESLIVVDVAPVHYSRKTDSMGEVAAVVQALSKLPLSTIATRSVCVCVFVHCNSFSLEFVLLLIFYSQR
jgi:pimeloyl-ACP methyl ester carboxylesterase